MIGLINPNVFTDKLLVANYLWGGYNNGATLLNSNQRARYVAWATGQGCVVVTPTAISGKRYCEFQMVAKPIANLNIALGICNNTFPVFYNAGCANIKGGAGGCGLTVSSGYYNNAAGVLDLAYAHGEGDRIGIAVDADTGKMWFRKNGTWITGDPAAGTGPTLTAVFAGPWYFHMSIYSCGTTSGTNEIDIHPTGTSQLSLAPDGFLAYQP